MRKFLIFIFLLTAAISYAQPVGDAPEVLNFRKANFEEIKQQAKDEDKIIFIKCYTKWCRTCKYMKRNVFPDQQLAKYFNANFVSAKLNMEKEENFDVAKKYEVVAYPTLLFLDTEGNVLLRIEGGPSAEELVKAAHNIIDK